MRTFIPLCLVAIIVIICFALGAANADDNFGVPSSRDGYMPLSFAECKSGGGIVMLGDFKGSHGRLCLMPSAFVLDK